VVRLLRGALTVVVTAAAGGAAAVTTAAASAGGQLSASLDVLFSADAELKAEAELVRNS